MEGNARSTIFSCPVTGCDGEPRALASTWFVTSLTSDGAHVYWTEGSEGVISRCEVTGCDRATVIGQGRQSAARSLVVDSQYVYWISAFSPDSWRTSSVWRAPKDGSGPAVAITPPLNQPGAVTIDSRYVLFTQRFSVGDVARCPLSGCPGEVSVIAGTQRFPFSIASDDEHVYWINAEPVGSTRPGAIMRAPLSAGPSEPEMLESRMNWGHPYDRMLAVDDAFVYWIDSGQLNRDRNTYPDACIRRTRKNPEP